MSKNLNKVKDDITFAILAGQLILRIKSQPGLKIPHSRAANLVVVMIGTMMMAAVEEEGEAAANTKRTRNSQREMLLQLALGALLSFVVIQRVLCPVPNHQTNRRN